LHLHKAANNQLKIKLILPSESRSNTDLFKKKIENLATLSLSGKGENCKNVTAYK
jgi:hypothetical protein